MFMIYRRITLSRLKKAYWTLTNNSKHIADETAVKTRTETELQMASVIHQSATASVHLPTHENLELQVFHSPGLMAGDGLYDLQVIGDKLFYVIGNTTEKGVKASAVTASVLAQVRTALKFQQEPVEIMNTINSVFDNNDKIAIRLQIGVLNLVTGALQYSNAGYHAPILVSNEITQLEQADSPAIGVQADYGYSEQKLMLAKGTKLLLYSDGIIDAENKAHKPFGDKKLRGSALQAVKMNAEIKPFLDYLVEAIRTYSGNSQPLGDQTIIVISR